MIPKHIALTNFLSYREASLDFSGLHVACIAGQNGAGKSSLLEAIGWALWGQSRVAVDDDVIHQGALEARVTFVFQQGEHCYRVIRSRHRQQGAGLEFQVQTEDGYRALTQRGIRATQQMICRHLKLDYDTFINSAYLRQGRADDFMLKRPSDRKEILASLLKLDRYDHLAEQAREQSRQAKAEATLRQTHLEELTTALAGYDGVLAQQTQLQQALGQLEADQAQAQTHLAQLQQLDQVCRHQQEQLHLYQQQQRQMAQLQAETQAAWAMAQTEQRRYHTILAEADLITAGLETLATLQAEDQALNQQFQQYQDWQRQREHLLAEYEGQAKTLQSQRQQAQTQLDAVLVQRRDLSQVLAQAESVQTAWDQLAVAKARLKRLDALQLQVGPLLQRRSQLQSTLQKEQTRLETRLEELKTAATHLRQQQQIQPQLEASAQEIDQTLSYLQQRQLYQEQVREKGLERRSFVESLQSRQRDCETQMAEIAQKLGLLGQPEASCPLCDRPLDQHHRTLVTDRHRVQQQELQDQIWVIREQLSVSEREIQVLRQEYRAVEAELELYAPVLQRQGSLEAQLASQSGVQQQLQQLELECHRLQQCLADRTYAPEVQAELRQIEQTLQQLAYDERDHALARGQVNRLRWADIKHHELTQARRQQKRLIEQQQQLEQTLADLDSQWLSLEQTPLKADLDQVQTALSQINYDADHHHQIRTALAAAQTWHLKQQELDQARQQLPQVDQRLADLAIQADQQRSTLVLLEEHIHGLTTDLQQQGYDPATAPAAIETLEHQIHARQRQRDDLLAQMGALAQVRQHLEDLQGQLTQKQQELAAARQRQQVYQELAHAFGRKGIQAMMIENLLPQLEAETNQILGRLSNHQMHVRFVTQRASKGRQDKWIDTLDIVIADAQGTRPYETYSGGEAFRVNFSLRLAIARLLAQRSGMALQMLIIDEGFGSQDEQGCDRLIAAINAIAADFACILTITHIPHFREAFQTRIDVTKTEQGSQLTLSL